MYDVKQAYAKVKQLSDRNYLIECCDFGEFWGFIFTKDKPNGEPFGGSYDCVHKTTGELFGFNPPDDFEVFDNGVILPLDIFD